MLGDDHPVVVSTMESIDLVENAKERAIPSANDFLAKWTGDGGDKDDCQSKETFIICNQSNMDNILSQVTSISPKNWIKQVGDVLVENSCGRPKQEDDDTPALDQASSSDQDMSSKYSV